MPVCGMAGTVENSNMLKAWSLASEGNVIWQGRQMPTQLAQGKGGSGVGGERTYKEPTIDANESPEAQTSGTNLASQLQAEMGGQSLPALLSMGEGASLS